MNLLKHLLFLLITSVPALHAACAEKSVQNLVAAPTDQAIIERAVARADAQAAAVEIKEKQAISCDDSPEHRDRCRFLDLWQAVTGVSAPSFSDPEQAIIIGNTCPMGGKRDSIQKIIYDFLDEDVQNAVHDRNILINFHSFINALRNQPQLPSDLQQPIQQQDTTDRTLIDLIGEYTTVKHTLADHRLLTILPNQHLLIQSTKPFGGPQFAKYNVKIYDLKQHKELAELPIYCAGLARAIQLSNGNIAMCNKDVLYIIDGISKQIIHEFDGPGHATHNLYELPDNKLLIVYGRNDERAINIQNLQNGQTIMHTFGVAWHTQTIPVFSNGNFIIPTDEHYLDLYNSDGECIQEKLKAPLTRDERRMEMRYSPSPLPKNLNILPNGLIIGSLVCKPNIYAWDAQTGEISHTIEHSHEKYSAWSHMIRCLESNVPRNKLISSDEDNIYVWNIDTGKLIKTYRFNTDGWWSYKIPQKIAITAHYLIISGDSFISILEDPTLSKAINS